MKEAETAMRRERFNLEEQVGGLVDPGGHRYRLHKETPATPPEPVWPKPVVGSSRTRPAIRAARATAAPRHRRVA